MVLPRRSRAPRPSRITRLSTLEALEGRLVPAVAAVPGLPIPPPASPQIEVQPSPSATDGLGPRPQSWSETSPWGSSPKQLAAAYGFDAVAFAGIAGNGAGETIAIVDAYDDPALVDSTSPTFATSDLAAFDRQYGLPDPPSFLKVGESGSAADLPGPDPSGAGTPGNWEQEEAMDVEWAHAMAPAASIVLVECQSSGGPDLYSGAQMAAALPGVTVVSMSWGAPEYVGEAGYDDDFTTPAGHPGVTFVAATGDSGAPGLYPAFSPNVLAVGGTTLTLQPDGSYGGESGWSSGGGGISVFEGQPAYQAGVQSTGYRTIPDVSLGADPDTGVSVYDSYDDTAGTGPWMRIGGTSLAAPVWASLIAIADQGRAAAGAPSLDGAGQVLPALYALPANDYHDVTTGGNGVFEASPGYDESTGLGSPMAEMVAPALAYDDLAPWLGIVSGPPSVVAAGQAFDLTVEVENDDGSLDAGFIGSVTIRLGDDPGGDTLGGTLTVPAVGGYATFTGLTLDHAGAGYTILASSPDGPASATSAPITVAAGAPAQLVVEPAATGHGAVGLTVAVEDAFGNLVTSYDGGVTLLKGGRGKTHARKGKATGTVAVASGGIATFSRVGSKTAGRRQVLQAETDGLVASAVLTPAARGQGS